MEDELRILANAEDWLLRYLGTYGWRDGDKALTGREVGALGLALTIETRRRAVLTAVGNSMLHLSRLEIVTVLDTCLQDAGMWELTQKWYERLCDWRAEGITFVPVSVAGDGQGDESVSVTVVRRDADVPPGDNAGSQ